MRNTPIDARVVVSEGALTRLASEGAQSSTSIAYKAPLISGRIIGGLVRLCDLIVIVGLGVALLFAYVGPSGEALIVYAPVIAVAGLSLIALLQFAGLYAVHALLRPADYVARLCGAWLFIAGLVIAFVFFSKGQDQYSRLWAAMWFMGGLAALALLRLAVSRVVRRWNAKGQLDRRAVLVGGGQPAENLIEALRASHDIDVSITGIFDDRDNARSPALVSGYRKLGNTNELIDFVRKNRVDLLIVTLPLTAETRLLDVVKRLWVLPVDIRLSAYTQKMRYRPRAYSYIGNVPFLDVFDKPLSDWGQVVKWIEDKTISALALLLLSPLMLIIAAAIKLDSKGPVFFKQRRFGFNNELIEVYKFRSMFTDKSDANATKLVSKGDPRVTRVGRFIRKTSLDELPQLINVLNGELSLVGPRPHATHAKAQDRLYDEAVEGYFARHRVKPGITGWAQVNGWRGETDTLEKIHRRVEHDLYYIENWSVLFDLYILARTPISLLNSENAY
jgi:Undecaprenyl-phosphate glucose phosphotransferase